jgi:hypothetical protein
MGMIELESMAVAMPKVEGHPNRAEFRGVLTLVDVPSQRAPSGSSGRKVVLTKKAAEAALPTLLGMALDYAPTFDRHDVRRKVGVITSAEIVGRNLEVGGYLYARDFPEIMTEIAESSRDSANENINPGVSRSTREDGARVLHGASGKQNLREGDLFRSSLTQAVKRLRGITQSLPAARERVSNLQTEASGSGLGMSYEVTDVVLQDKRARIWTLLKVTFTGAAILRRNKAAYSETWIELV